MQIKDFYTPESSTLKGSFETREHSVPNTDARFFTSMLEHPTPSMTALGGQGSPTLLAEAAQQLRHTENNLIRLLKSSKNSADMEAFTEYPRELSKAVLTSQLLVKCLGKTTQCIDKLSNLQ